MKHQMASVWLKCPWHVGQETPPNTNVIKGPNACGSLGFAAVKHKSAQDPIPKSTDRFGPKVVAKNTDQENACLSKATSHPKPRLMLTFGKARPGVHLCRPP